MIETSVLNKLLLDAFSGEITWLEAATHHPLDEFIDSFFRTRAVMQKTIADLSDAQVAFIVPGNPMWSISEMVTHLIYSQNGYYNLLLDLANTTELPHIVEAARGFGEGAKRDVPAAELRENLQKATDIIKEGIEKTRAKNDPTVMRESGLFGKVNYQTWLLLMLGHEVDHVRQGI